VPACRYAESAIREAIKKYDITDPEQERPPSGAPNQVTRMAIFRAGHQDGKECSKSHRTLNPFAR
jgi:hypothetical protein